MLTTASPFLAQRLFMLTAGILFGGLITVGFLVTPTLFSFLDDKQVAGMIAGQIFKNTSFFCLLLSLLLLILANRLIKKGYSSYKSLRWLLICVVCLTLAGTFFIQPMMEDLRELALSQGAPVMLSPFAQQFSRLHQASSVMFTIEVILCAVVYWVASQTTHALKED